MMVALGFPVKGLRFEWDNTDKMTEAEMREEERSILQYYRIDPTYFANKYNIPIIGERGEATTPTSEDQDDKKEGEAKLSHGDDFFA